jgi:2-iminobutanoate/2-iminopropanoate deaminase
MNTVQTDDAPRTIGPYSQAVQVDGWLYASGQLPMTPAGDMVEGDIEAQTEQVFNNIEAILKAAGGSLSQVVKATVFVQDLNDFARLNAVYERRFAGHKPARSTVEVARLPRDARVEIEIIARLA